MCNSFYFRSLAFFLSILKDFAVSRVFSLVVVNTRILHVPFPAKFLLFVDLIGGSESGGPLVGCRLKFSYFVGSRLKISIFVGCRLISVNK